MGIDLSRFQVLVAEQLLYCANIRALAQKLGGKAVPQCMARTSSRQCYSPHSVFYSFLHSRRMDMMKNDLAGVVEAGA